MFSLLRVLFIVRVLTGRGLASFAGLVFGAATFFLLIYSVMR